MKPEFRIESKSNEQLYTALDKLWYGAEQGRLKNIRMKAISEIYNALTSERLVIYSDLGREIHQAASLLGDNGIIELYESATVFSQL